MLKKYTGCFYRGEKTFYKGTRVSIRPASEGQTYLYMYRCARKHFLGDAKKVNLFFNEETFDIEVKKGSRLKIRPVGANAAYERKNCCISLQGFIHENDLEPADIIGRYYTEKIPDGLRILHGSRGPLRQGAKTVPSRRRMTIALSLKEAEFFLKIKGSEVSWPRFFIESARYYIRDNFPAEWEDFILKAGGD